jgi:hypothetical protein
MIQQRLHPDAFKAAVTGLLLLAAWIGLGLSATAQAQQNYGQYYQKELKKTGGGGMGLGNSNRYLYDKYFYHNPSVSPYLSAVRGGNLSGTSYYANVKPELERRRANERAQAAYVQQRKQQGNIGDTRFPGAITGGGVDASYLKPVPSRPTKPSSYYNHWYGGWNNR